MNPRTETSVQLIQDPTGSSTTLLATSLGSTASRAASAKPEASPSCSSCMSSTSRKLSCSAGTASNPDVCRTKDSRSFMASCRRLCAVLNERSLSVLSGCWRKNRLATPSITTLSNCVAGLGKGKAANKRQQLAASYRETTDYESVSLVILRKT